MLFKYSIFPTFHPISKSSRLPIHRFAGDLATLKQLLTKQATKREIFENHDLMHRENK